MKCSSHLICFGAIKLDVDRRRTPGRFLLTGSANVLLLPKLSESLAGRIESMVGQGSKALDQGAESLSQRYGTPLVSHGVERRTTRRTIRWRRPLVGGIRLSGASQTNHVEQNAAVVLLLSNRGGSRSRFCAGGSRREDRRRRGQSGHEAEQPRLSTVLKILPRRWGSDFMRVCCFIKATRRSLSGQSRGRSQSQRCSRNSYLRSI